MKSAPQEFEAWAVYDTERFKQMNLDLKDSRTAPITATHKAAGVLMVSDKFDPVESDLTTYDVSPEASENMQKMAELHGQKVPAVMFRFKSNWGKEDYTCVYRVRVHAQPFKP